MAAAYQTLGTSPVKVIVQFERMVLGGMFVGKQIPPHSSIGCTMARDVVDVGLFVTVVVLAAEQRMSVQLNPLQVVP